jgi:hypothetical protein
MKKFLNIFLVITMLFFVSKANADEIKIGKKSYTAAAAVGIKAEDYYTIVVGDSTSVQDVTTAFVFYIPNEIFANGTYDLVSLVDEVDSIDEAVSQCESEEESDEDADIILPDTNKVYLVGSSTKVKQQGKFIKGKGVSIADKDFKGAQITISGIGSAETSPLIENVTLSFEDTNLPVIKVNYKVFVSEDCQEIAQKSKFKASKKVKNAKISVDVTATVVTLDVPNI